MIVERLVEALPVKSELIKLIVGAAMTGILISLGVVFVLSLTSFAIKPALPSIFAGIGAAIFTVKFKKRHPGDH